MKSNKIIIVGAGLCGSLLAIRLAQRNFSVEVYEKRADIRKVSLEAGRSINLALSNRGLNALDLVGIKDDIIDMCIPMRGRLIHPLGHDQFLSPYSGRSADYINSVSRTGLNALLLDKAESYSNIKLNFETSVKQVDLESATISYIDKDKQQNHCTGTVVMGTDGAGSVVRRSLMSRTTKLLFNYSQSFLRTGYKELSISAGSNKEWKIEKECLHIWPRDSFMIIALPNIDGSFTLTMFHPYEGTAGFNTLSTEEEITQMFEQYYPSLLPFIPNYLEEYKRNPVGTLGTIKCYPWQANGKVMVLGDAAHAIVPFYGQGMNASFEDVLIFDQILDQVGDDWNTVFKLFQDKRSIDTDAIADLAVDNFYEMQDKVNDVSFIRKRKIEMQLEQQFDSYYSKYSLVTFKPELPYHKAMELGRKQDELLLKLCSADDFDNKSLEFYFNQLKLIN